jgi:hypothetical protein
VHIAPELLIVHSMSSSHYPSPLQHGYSTAGASSGLRLSGPRVLRMCLFLTQPHAQSIASDVGVHDVCHHHTCSQATCLNWHPRLLACLCVPPCCAAHTRHDVDPGTRHRKLHPEAASCCVGATVHSLHMQLVLWSRAGPTTILVGASPVVLAGRLRDNQALSRHTGVNHRR